MRIALAQINPTLGDFEANFAKIIEFISKAKRKKADIVVFPELALSGYPPEDLLFKDSFRSADRKYLRRITQVIPSSITVILGCVAEKNGKMFNSAAVLTKNKICDIYHKVFLPNYSVFDEKRYFSAGQVARVYLYNGIKLGLTICEDIWKADFCTALKQNFKPDIVINISASPFFVEKLALRTRILSQRAKQMGSFIVYCNLVGGQDELVFDGTSLVINPEGKVILSAERFRQDLLVFDTKKRYSPKPLVINKIEEIYNALLLGIRDYTRKNGFQRAVIGVSGGIDSAVTLSLAVAVLGRRNVYALIMPSKYTSKGTLADAVKISKTLRIRYQIVPIDSIYSLYLQELKTYLKKGKASELTCQNLQARIRGNLLMAFSNRFGYLVLNTGNKSEVSVGYSTLYGDMVGGFGVLKDVYKNNVYKLARFINRNQAAKIIPDSVIKRAPSAELKPQQRDDDDLPAYSLLDKVLKLYIEEDKSVNQIAKVVPDKRLVSRIINMVDKNEYKRRQAPPGIKITPKAFGKDRRMPITNKFFR